MPKINQKVRIALVAMLIITLGNLATTLYSQARHPLSRGQDNARNKDQRSERAKESKSRFPIADYNAPEDPEPAKRAKRKARNERHNNSMMGVKGGLTAPPDSGDEIVLRTDWEVNVPQLPAAQSSVVVTGEIVDANAYISADKNGVYSEFGLRVEETLKKDDTWAVSAGEVISVERQGGRVRYLSGRVEWYRIALQDLPLVNHRYVLFLKRMDEDSFSIITGYELSEGHVYALDSASQFRALDGADEIAFLQSVRGAIAK